MLSTKISYLPNLKSIDIRWSDLCYLGHKLIKYENFRLKGYVWTWQGYHESKKDEEFEENFRAYREVLRTQEGHQGCEKQLHQRNQSPESWISAHPLKPNRILHGKVDIHTSKSGRDCHKYCLNMARIHTSAHSTPDQKNIG